MVKPIVFVINILFFLTASILAAADVSVKSHDFVVSGVIINSGNANLIERFTQYLTAKSGHSLKPVFASTYQELSNTLRDNPDAIGWTCGAPYVQDHALDKQQLLSVPLFNGKPLYYSVIVTRKGRPEKSLTDFKQQILSYSDPRSNSGFVAPAFQLKKQGIAIKTHFRLLLNAGNHERSITAVLNGLADVAAIDEYVWVEYLKKFPQTGKSLHIIDRIGPFPFTPVVAGRSVPSDTIDKLNDALVNMPADAEGRQLLKELGIDGFVIKQNKFYDDIKVMLTELGWRLN
ncbi:MAG TPA: hypothetical protein ENI64_00465 [Gammaproteobacteria bacterium]|nr:hypothetical protein [Gammaproteobacteria bacterium]